MTLPVKSNTQIQKKHHEIYTVILSFPVNKKTAQLIESTGLKVYFKSKEIT
jgi:hypothetical protein